MGIDLPLCSEDVNNILQVVIQREKLNNPRIILSFGSEIGEGFLGINCSVELSEANKVLHLFIKEAPKLQKFREKAQVRIAYQNEFRFYNYTYPVMEEFYRKRTGQSLNVAPKYYAGSNEELKEILVLENLKAAGFQLCGAHTTFDSEHLLVLMQEYGKLHGVSFALKSQKKEVFDNLSRDLPDFYHLIFDTLDLSEMVKGNCKVVERYLQSPEDARLLDIIRYISENVESLIFKFKNFSGDHRVILHGDCNNNNIMFKKQETGMDVRLVDFQGVKYNSPVLDLSYLIYAAGLSEENLAQLHLFINTYYDSLSDTIRRLGSDPEELCPMSVIKEHWNMFGIFGVILALLVLQRIVNVKEMDMVKTVETEKGMLAIKIENEDEYARRIKCLLKHFVDNKFT